MKEIPMTASKYLVVVAGAALAAGAFAGDKDHSMSDRKFDQLDQNQDSVLSKSEVASDATLSVTFASIDADGDGQITRSEYTAYVSERDTSSRSSNDWNTAPDETEEGE
jgi:hypothetical protein